jgi:hypothetical protein
VHLRTRPPRPGPGNLLSTWAVPWAENMPSLRRPFDSIGRLRVNLRRSKPPSRHPRNPSSHSLFLSSFSLCATTSEPLSLLLSQSSLFRAGSGEAPTASEQRHPEPLQRRACPSVGGRAVVERLHGGALPTHALTNQGLTMILRPVVPPLRDATTMTVVATIALHMRAAR